MRRRGFTIIELASSLFVSAVVLVAMASSVTLATRALPDASKPAETTVTVQRVLDVVASDARFATSVSIISEHEMSMETPDRNGDDAADVIKYVWSGTAGDPLTRTDGALGAATIIASADEVKFAWAQDAGTSDPISPRLVCSIRVGLTEMAGTTRCLNVEYP